MVSPKKEEEKGNSMWGEGCVTFHNVYIYKIIMVYTSNTYNFTCQLYLNKAKKKTRKCIGQNRGSQFCVVKGGSGTI